jgi:hypothetical protein
LFQKTKMAIVLFCLTPAPAFSEPARFDPQPELIVAEQPPAIRNCAQKIPSLKEAKELLSWQVDLIASSLWHGSLCKRDQKLALSFLDAYVGSPPNPFVEFTALRNLLGYLDAAKPKQRDAARIDAVKRAYWLTFAEYDEHSAPFWTQAERQAFLLRPDSLSYLEKCGRQQYDFACSRLIEARLIGGTPAYDPVGAYRVAAKMASWTDSRDLALKLKVAGLIRDGVGDKADPRTALRLFLGLAGWSAAARDNAFLLAESALRSPSDDERMAALRAMVQLRGGDPRAAEALEKEVARSGGFVEWTKLNPAPSLSPFVIDDQEYSPGHMRNEEEGLVKVSLVFGPDGRPLYSDSNLPRLAETVVHLWLKRSLKSDRLTGNEGRFVRISLPDVLFRIVKKCDDPSDTKTPPKPPGLIVVDGYCNVEI